MNRVDRLVAMVLHLQGRRVVRAEELARTFEISERTVYRDIAALGEAGVPVVGEAGVGYSLARGYHLPPVMFTVDEALAMAVGEDLVRAMTDASVEGPMREALVKIRSVLPGGHQDTLDRLRRATAVSARSRGKSENPARKRLLPVQRAAIARNVLRVSYSDRQGNATARDIEPLGVVYHHDAWYTVAWCRLRKGLRHFRVDRMVDIAGTGERFAVREDFSLTDHLAQEGRGGRAPVEVVVQISRPVAARARADEWFEIVSEREVAGETVELTLRAHALEHAAWWIVSTAGEAVAVAPPELREKVAAMAEAILAKHRLAKPS